LIGNHNQLGAVAGAELEHRAADVSPGGGWTDHEPRGDLVVGEAVGDDGKYLSLALGEFVRRRGNGARWSRSGGVRRSASG